MECHACDTISSLQVASSGALSDEAITRSDWLQPAQRERSRMMRKFTLLKARKAETLLDEIEQIQKRVSERAYELFRESWSRVGGRAERLARCRAADHLETGG